MPLQWWVAYGWQILKRAFFGSEETRNNVESLHGVVVMKYNQ